MCVCVTACGMERGIVRQVWVEEERDSYTHVDSPHRVCA